MRGRSLSCCVGKNKYIYKEKTILNGIVFSLYRVINVCGVGILCILITLYQRVQQDNRLSSDKYLLTL